MTKRLRIKSGIGGRENGDFLTVFLAALEPLSSIAVIRLNTTGVRTEHINPTSRIKLEKKEHV